MTTVLGVSAFYHDSAAALVVDGDIVAASQEERFSRRKHDARFPVRAIEHCLAAGGLRPDDLDYVAFYDKPLAKFDRLLETYLSYAPAGFRSFSAAMPSWLKRKLFLRRAIARAFGAPIRAPIVFLDHHESHAASAFFPSPFERAAILTVDGVGEWSTATLGRGEGSTIALDQQLRFPHSLGLLYSAFTYHCGFAVNDGEYKLMGLAPYGQPTHLDAIASHLADLKPDGSLWLNMDYFNYCQGLTMTGPRFDTLFGGPPRRPGAPLDQRHMDLAASIQAFTEEAVLRMARHVHQRTGLTDLVMAGGVALNAVANGRLVREGPFERIWIQPAAGDAGGALGAALFVAHQLVGRPRLTATPDGQHASWLGPAYPASAIDAVLRDHRAVARRIDREDALLDLVADALAAGGIVGWFQGRSEFGPRALGARSILGDPRSPRMQADINRTVKFRESFRPFAPSVLREHAHEWFDVRPDADSAYMLTVAPVAEGRRCALSPADAEALAHDPDLIRRVNILRSTVPAVTHVDYSARLQTVDERHGLFHRLLRRFHDKTGCPMLVNTSFNLSWEPIVEQPAEAYHTFMQSSLDLLVLGDVVLRKDDQPLGLQTWTEAGSTPPPASPWADPHTGDPLAVTRSGAMNPRTGASYRVEDNIPRLFAPGPDAPREATARDHDEAPSPVYDGIETPRALIEHARADPFTRLLNEQLPYDARILEVGCGTGRLTNFLSLAHRTTLGVDSRLGALRVAEAFRQAHCIARATFAQMNPLRPALKDAFFDVVINTAEPRDAGDPQQSWQRAGRLVRPGGFLVVGLPSAYVRHARLAWARDRGPGGTGHTLDELLGWLTDDGFTFVNAIPKPAPGPSPSARERLFEAREPGTRLGRIASQLAALRGGYHGSGSLVMIARRGAERPS